MLRNDAHEAWLDEHVDDWGDRTPADLASVVTEHAAETEYDEVFEDTAGGHDHGGGHGRDAGRPDVTGGDAMGGAAEAVVDDAVESVLEEAQELTEAMYGLDEGDGDGDADAVATDDGEESTADGDDTDAEEESTADGDDTDAEEE
ncbi:DUF5810 domain-containing protein [Halobaculum litoreum]|uniref:DUF5810 domain-containing protein n=2 Tax=Halobaculum litoreum TaxID=3031998 RepID=A0ABD5XKZ2_9EURY